jgi:hypothetical protein
VCEGLLILNSEAETLVAIISPLELMLPEADIGPLTSNEGEPDSGERAPLIMSAPPPVPVLPLNMKKLLKLLVLITKSAVSTSPPVSPPLAPPLAIVAALYAVAPPLNDRLPFI